MRAVFVLVGAVATIGCSTPQQQSDRDLQRAAGAIDQAAKEFESQMSPEERRAFDQQVEQGAIAEMQARAASCGTKLHFSGEARFVDRSVFVDESATPEQLSCVQESYPFVKAFPR